MKAGVRISPWAVVSTPARASPSKASIRKLSAAARRFAQPRPSAGATPCLLPLRAYRRGANRWGTRSGRKANDAVAQPSAPPQSQHHHRIAERVEPVPLLDGGAID